MAKLSREAVEKIAGLTDGDKADLLALFDEVTKKDGEISELRSKAPRDSELVVQKTDFDKLQQTLRERESLITELRGKLDGLSVPSLNPMEAFSAITDLIG